MAIQIDFKKYPELAEPIRIERERRDKEQRDADRQRRKLREMEFILRHRLPDGSMLADVEANGVMILELLGPGFTYALFRDLVSFEKYRTLFVWEKPTPRVSVKEQEAAARQLIVEYAKQTEAYGLAEANFNMICSTLGAGFAWDDLDTAIRNGQLSLAPATFQEVSQWRSEAAKAHSDWLRTEATPQQLKQAVREEAVQNRLQQQQQEAHRQQQVIMQAQSHYPALPDFTATGEKIDSAYLMRLSVQNYEQFKQLVKKHGSARITARIRATE